MPQIKRSYGGEEKRNHTTITILEKVDIIKKLDSGSSVNFLAQSFGISPRTVYDIKKRKEKILNYYVNRDSDSAIAQRKTIKAAKSKDLDNVLYEWFRQRKSDGVPISGPLLQAKAKELHDTLQIKEAYTFSSGWLSCFKKRHGICYMKACRKKSSADTQAAEDFIGENQELIGSVLNPSEVNSDTESEDEAKISYDQGLASGYQYLSFLQQHSFISQQEIAFVQRLQKKITGVKRMAKKKSKNDVMTVDKIYETIQTREFFHELWWDILSDIKEKPTYKHLKRMVDNVIQDTVCDFDIPQADEAEQSRRRTAMAEISIMTYTIDTVISEVLYRKFHYEYQSLVRNLIQDLLIKKTVKEVPSDVKGGSVSDNIERILANDPDKEGSKVRGILQDASKVTRKSEYTRGESSSISPRKRGRPRKIAPGDVHVSEAKAKVQNADPKRKRGRPPVSLSKIYVENELKENKPKNTHIEQESDAESDVSVGNLSTVTVSSVHTSELSSFEDTISVGSNDEDGGKKLIPLKVANEMYRHGRLSEIYKFGKIGEKQKIMQKASDKNANSKTGNSSSTSSSSPLCKVLPQRIRKPNSKYNSETMYCYGKDDSSFQDDSGSSSSEDDASAELQLKPKRRKKQSSEDKKDSQLISSPTTKNPFVLLHPLPRSTLASMKVMAQDHAYVTKNSNHDTSDLHKPCPVIGSNYGSRSTAITLFST